MPINSGEVFSVAADGEIEWRAPKRVQASGSYDKKISIKSVGGDGRGNATHLWVSGNPSKFLQGHNVFGSDDLVNLVYDTFVLICNQFKFKPSFNELLAVRSGDYEVNLVDINYSYELRTRSDVLAFIRAMEFKAKTRHGRPVSKGGTLYFGKTSERWAIKLYCKAEEITSKTGRLPDDLIGRGIESWADNKLRVELRLHNKELIKLDLSKAKYFKPNLIRKLFNDYIGKVKMSDQVILSDEVIEGLPNNLRTSYTLWSEGHDLRFLMSKRTYYRHRRELLEFGINIDMAPCGKASTNVVPMFRVLEAKPAEIPRWAFNEGLVHHSALEDELLYG